ncbi:hypothetical protein EPO33_02295 [Patescibacteria group bacterium]|nr:MAG: hypothetical protein EPO33_02295 [Patescibacteria group bacterium]
MAKKTHTEQARQALSDHEVEGAFQHLLEPNGRVVPKFTLQTIHEMTGIIWRLAAVGVLTLRDDIDLHAIAMQAFLRPLRRQVIRVRTAAQRGDVTGTIRPLRAAMRRYGIPPHLIGTTLQELEALQRQGCAARARKTIATVRAAVARGGINGRQFVVLYELDGFMQRSGQSVQDFGFGTEQDYRSFLRETALPYLRQEIADAKRGDSLSFGTRYYLGCKQRFGLSDADLGLEPGELEEVERKGEASRHWRPSPQYFTDFILSLRKGEAQHSPPRDIIAELRKSGFRPQDVGSTEDELRELLSQWPRLHALYHAERYRTGKVPPATFFKEIDKLGIHPSVVGIEPGERDLFA